ncbi:MAG: LacI family DNA-binding transcriptional regulator [Chloroflexota bacterium]
MPRPRRDSAHPSRSNGARPARATIFDVARAADVSHATVSRVVNGSQNVRQETRQRVEAAMRELGYVAHVSARALARGRTQVLGLLAQEVDNAFFTQVIGGVDQQASAQGYDFLVCTTHARREKEAEYVARLSRGMVDGLLIVLPRGLPDYVEQLRADAFPFVLIDYDDNAPGCSVVNASNRTGTRDAIRYLVGLGHRHIGFITGRDNVGATHARLAGYRDEMAAAGLAVRAGDVLEGDFLETRGHAAATEMLRRPDRVTAIFASSDMAAFGVMRAAADLGIDVPAQLSVVGFDDIPEAARVNPALTTVRQPLREMGRVAVDQLLGRLHDPTRPASRVVLDTELILRGTTAPPP